MKAIPKFQFLLYHGLSSPIVLQLLVKALDPKERDDECREPLAHSGWHHIY